MKTRVLVTVCLMVGCHQPPAEIDLDVGDIPPAQMRSGEFGNVTIVTRPDDCVNCNLRGGFLAVRSFQRSVDSARAPKVLVLLVTPNVSDTAFTRKSLDLERIAADIEAISPRDASRVFDASKIPAIYLVQDGRVVREWESKPLGRLDIARREIVDAVPQTAGAVPEM